MRPVPRIGRQHQARDLEQPAHAGQQLAIEEAKFCHGEHQQGKGRGHEGERRLPEAIEALEMLGVTAANGAEIDGKARWHQCCSCRPIRRWRMCEVSVSITDTVMMISTRMADTSE